MSQLILIKNHLESGRSITPLEALQSYGSFRLGSVVNRLRNKGMNILTELVDNQNGGKYARYKLMPKGDLFAKV